MGGRTAITFTCSNCGCPLPLTNGVVKCPRCGTDNFVSLPTQPQQVVAPASPNAGGAGFAPSLGPHIPMAVLVQPAQRGGCVGIGVLIAVLAIAGAGVGAYFVVQRGQQAESVVSWSGSQQGICLVDTNGDGKKDVVGSGTIGAGQSLVAIDAATGKIVWNKPASSADASRMLLCGGGGIVSIDPMGSSVISIDPKTGKQGWTKQLSDKLESFAFGEKCLALTTIDKATVSLDLSSGKPRACDTHEPAKGLYEKQEGAAIGDTKIELTSSTGPGTPRLIVQATSKDKVLWSATFAELLQDNARVLATPEGVVVAARSRANEGDLTVQLLDAKNGAVLRTRQVKVKDASSFMKLAHNDKALFVESFGMLHTYTLATLEPGWWVGSFWVDK